MSFLKRFFGKVASIVLLGHDSAAMAGIIKSVSFVEPPMSMTGSACDELIACW